MWRDACRDGMCSMVERAFSAGSDQPCASNSLSPRARNDAVRNAVARMGDSGMMFARYYLLLYTSTRFTSRVNISGTNQ